jgi:membrane-bound lytic murein transglycosylase B
MPSKVKWVGFAFFAVFAALFSAPGLSYAQEASLTPQQRAALQQELSQVEADQAAAQAQLKAAQSQSASLSRDIAILDAKIKTAQLNIKAKNLLIKTLGNDIADKQSHIVDLEAHIAKGKQTLSDLLRKTNELDNHSFSQVLLSQSTVSGFFHDVDTFQSVQEGLQNTFESLRADASTTQAEKDSLDARRNAEIDARHTIQVEQANITADQTQQKQLLAVSKGNEKSYSSIIAQKQARASQIRAALFALSGAQAIPFGDALNYANAVNKVTGVPPAFLLAILTQETNLGKNVGTCYLTNTSDGSGINTRTNAYVPNVMKPTRDVQPFISITSSLGLDYQKMVVSCPQSIGYGGGMGPAQFIASTWMLLKDRISQAVGSSIANPWKPADAFMAAGLYLGDLGAGSSSYTAQRNAACKYYSGGSCKASNGSSGYGSSVMALADRIQRDQINPLLGL